MPSHVLKAIVRLGFAGSRMHWRYCYLLSFKRSHTLAICPTTISIPYSPAIPLRKHLRNDLKDDDDGDDDYGMYDQ